MGSVIDISFPPGTDPNNPIGYACGGEGRIWEIASTGLTDLNTGLRGDFYGTSASSVNNVWTCGGNRIYYYNGTDFTSQLAPGGTFNDIHFVNDQLGWVVGDGGIIGGTAEGGESWLRLQSYNNEFSLYGVHSPNGKDVWAVGTGGTVLHSPNGDDFHPKEPYGWEINTVWNREAEGLTNSFLRGIFFTSAANGYISGNNGILLKYSKLVTDVKENHQPQKFMLKQNYPNPFNPSTKIQYTIPQSPLLGGDGRGGLVTLKVYDILGREVATLVNKAQRPGNYEVEFGQASSNPLSRASRHLSSGVYFYQLRYGEFVETKKMLLLK
jgi:hypothetical protein